MSNADNAMKAATTSFSSRVENLIVGETTSLCRRLEHADPEFKKPGEVTKNIRNSVDPIVAKMRKRTGNDFRVESGSYVTRDSSLMIVVSVTRIDGDGDVNGL
jgi:hypothetical protein